MAFIVSQILRLLTYRVQLHLVLKIKTKLGFGCSRLVQLIGLVS